MVLRATKEFEFLEFVFVQIVEMSQVTLQVEECVECDDIFILQSLILSLFVRRESLSILGLLTLIRLGFWKVVFSGGSI